MAPIANGHNPSLDDTSPTPGEVLQAVAGVLPDHLAADLLTDKRASTIASRLAAVDQVVDQSEVVEHCTSQLPDPVGSMAGLVWHRLPNLERYAAEVGRQRGEQARARREAADRRRARVTDDGYVWDEESGRWEQQLA